MWGSRCVSDPRPPGTRGKRGRRASGAPETGKAASLCVSAFPRFRAIALASSILLAPAPILAADEPETSFSHRIAQGKFFLEQGQNAQARAEFQAAAELPTGKNDPEVHALLAKAAYLVGDVGEAVGAVKTAKALTSGSMPAELSDLYEFLTTRFGKVLVIGAGSDGASVPEPAVPILDPPLKRAYSRAIDRLNAPVSGGSTSIWLPVGTYRVGGLLVDVRAESTARMDLRGGVGAAGGGVYGERSGSGGRADPAPPEVSPSLALRVGGVALSQQGNATGGGRIVVSFEGHLPTAFGFRFGGGVALSRAERLTASMPAPAAPEVFFAGGLGGLIPLGPLLLAPWATLEVGYTRPLAAGLPDAYDGPYEYLVIGPDLEVRLLLPTSTTGSGLGVTPEFALRFVARETRPLGEAAASDPRPHLSIGAGFDVGLRFGEGG